jgi:hypothetical protein
VASLRSSPPPCPMPMGRCTSAIWSATSRPTSGCGRGACWATRRTSSAPTTPTARRSCSPPKRPGSRRRPSSRHPGQPRARLRRLRRGIRSLPLDAFAENREIATAIYLTLREGGFIARRTIEQLYDPVKGMFLPDRYIKGECPKCGTPTSTATTASPAAPPTRRPTSRTRVSVLSGATPVLRESEHYFFEVGDFEGLLREWLTAGDVAHSRSRPSCEWLDEGLRDWDISRDAPYFGFEIPDAPGKYFYVWLDAPIGYLASFKNYCNRTASTSMLPGPGSDRAAPLHRQGHRNFHGLFWPAMLHGSGQRTPTRLHVPRLPDRQRRQDVEVARHLHQARTYLEHLNPSTCATTSRPSSARASRTSTSTSRTSCARERRPGRQVRQHREPLRRLHRRKKRWRRWSRRAARRWNR